MIPDFFDPTTLVPFLEGLPTGVRISQEGFNKIVALCSHPAVKVTIEWQGRPLSGLNLYIDHDLLPEESVLMTRAEEREWAQAVRKV